MKVIVEVSKDNCIAQRLVLDDGRYRVETKSLTYPEYQDAMCGTFTDRREALKAFWVRAIEVYMMDEQDDIIQEYYNVTVSAG